MEYIINYMNIFTWILILNANNLFPFYASSFLSCPYLYIHRDTYRLFYSHDSLCDLYAYLIFILIYLFYLFSFSSLDYLILNIEVLWLFIFPLKPLFLAFIYLLSELALLSWVQDPTYWAFPIESLMFRPNVLILKILDEFYPLNEFVLVFMYHWLSE